jgi:hypothetical protein
VGKSNSSEIESLESKLSKLKSDYEKMKYSPVKIIHGKQDE